MSEIKIREPIQKRSIETKDKIIEAGFELICKYGFYNVSTPKIAKKAGVSTGIIYQYFKDKKDIFLCGLDKFINTIFYPTLNISNISIKKDELRDLIKQVINEFIAKHKLSKVAHKELTTMMYSDKDIEEFFQKKEIEITNNACNILIKNNFNISNMKEKVHLSIELIENLSHEIVYNNQNYFDFEVKEKLITNEIINLLKEE